MTLQNFLALLICSCLIIPKSEACTNKSSNIKAKQVSPEQMKQVIDNQNNVSRVEYREANAPYHALNLGADLATHSNFDKDEVLVIFAIIGTVLVVAWLVSVPIELYNAVVCKDDFDVIQITTLHYAGRISGKETSDFNDFISGRYSLFSKRKDEELSGNFLTGASAEVGYFGFEKSRNYGLYWLLGPSFLLGGMSEEQNFIFGKLDLLAGTAFNNNIGFMAKAEFSLNIKLESGLIFGAAIGGEHHEVKNNKGLITDPNPAVFFGGNIGYFF